MKNELIIDKYGFGNAVVVAETIMKLLTLFIDPPVGSTFIHQVLLFRAKIQREYLKEEDIS